MKKITTEQLLKETIRTLSTAAVSLIFLAAGKELYTAVTGEEITSTRMFEENGVKAVVIKGDTAFFATPKSESLLTPSIK